MSTDTPATAVDLDALDRAVHIRTRRRWTAVAILFVAAAIAVDLFTPGRAWIGLGALAQFCTVIAGYQSGWLRRDDEVDERRREVMSRD